MLENIESIIKKNTSGNEETFLDVFAGTNVVGNYFKKDYTIYTNDILYFSYVHSKATIENNKKLTFDLLHKNGIGNPLEYFESDELIKLYSSPNYYEKSYTPTGNSMYLSIENGRRIDAIRQIIEDWNYKGWLTDYEYYYLLSTLIESIPSVSNTTGTYGAFLKKWDRRALNPLEMPSIEVIDNRRKNKAYNEDSNELIKHLDVDIAYIDPPYNNRQYASNYHLLENVARNTKPKLNGKTNIFDWSSLKSYYSMKRKALESMTELIENINATHVVLSYNNEGIIPEKELLNLMKRHAIEGNIEVQRIPYRKYKSKTPSKTYDLYEILIYIQKRPLSKHVLYKKDDKIKPDKWKMKSTKYIKSPLNYIGGKHRLLKQILPLFPQNINTFVDLFSGGANVGINVKANNYIFNDMNYRINEMFRYFSKQTPDILVSKIKKRIAEYGLSKTNEDAYKQFRKDYNLNPNPLDLYVLVSYSYNYQFRFNNSMEFNNPFGRNRSQFSENMEKSLRAFLSKLNTIEAVFTDELFTDLDLTTLGKDDFVYLDPPYLITTGNYNDGNRGFVNWGKQQEIAMYELMNQLTNQGVRYALSNVLEHKEKSNDYLQNFIEQSGSFVHYLDYNYSNASHNTKRTGSIEVLITNYDPETFKIKNAKTIVNRKESEETAQG